jgi:hypothetical protein
MESNKKNIISKERLILECEKLDREDQEEEQELADLGIVFDFPDEPEY